jgi:DNA mismatch repair ATPase MutS
VFLLSGNAVESLRIEVVQAVSLLYKVRMKRRKLLKSSAIHHHFLLPQLSQVSEALALLDVIASLTHCALAGRYTRPRFGDELSIHQGRHPILDQRDHEKTVPNETRLGKGKTFQLLSGPNSSGKTTYLKQVALLTIMARIGSL